MRQPCPKCGGAYWHEDGREGRQCRSHDCLLWRAANEPNGQPYVWPVENMPVGAVGWSTLCPVGCLMILQWETA
jgi:hypothetical protein